LKRIFSPKSKAKELSTTDKCRTNAYSRKGRALAQKDILFHSKKIKDGHRLPPNKVMNSGYWKKR